MNILHLVLFSHDEYYDQMYKLTNVYYRQFGSVKTVYYTYSSEYEQSDDVLCFKGHESYVPGILEKTLRAFDYFKEDVEREYEYVVRSNVSTIVNFELLFAALRNTLKKRPVDYAGGKVLNLQWLDPRSGVVDDLWHGTKYASGTCIILSKKMFMSIVKHKAKLRKEFIDDLAIGIYIREYHPYIQPVAIHPVAMDGSSIIYRNRSNNRFVDVENMKEILKVISDV